MDSIDMHAWLDSRMERFKKGSCWWVPSHGLALNLTLFGVFNVWRFTTLSFRYRPYRAEDERRDGDPEGILYRPIWVPYNDPRTDNIRGTYPNNVPSEKKLEFIIDMFKNAMTVSDIIAREWDYIEDKYKVQIPDSIRAKYIGDANKTAARRWGVNRLKIEPELIPFNGGKRIKLDSWGDLRR